jgi:hypothetical protein
VVRHPAKLSKFKVLWPVSFLLICCLLLALLISTGSVPQGTAPQVTVPQGTLQQGAAPHGASPHHVAADPTSASDKFSYLGTDSQGIASYSVISAENGHGPQILRVLTPAHPAPGVSHNFLIVLPVEAGLGTLSVTGSRPCRPLTRKTSTTSR